MNITDNILGKFESKQREFSPNIFAGVMINPDPEGYFPEQNVLFNQIEKLPEDFDFIYAEQFVIF